MLAVPCIGFVGHAVRSEAPTRNLRGPVLSHRVGVFHAESLEGTWAPEARRPPSDEGTRERSPFSLVLYQAVPGAFEETTEQDRE